MKHFAITLKRWNDFRSALLHLGEGKLDQQLKIRNLNDAFERMEVLFNMVVEELRRRLLHVSFTKPAGFQRYTRHYVLITNKNFGIQNTCDGFLTRYQQEPESLRERSFLELTDDESATILKENYSKTTEQLYDDLHHIELFEDRFMCSISRISGTSQLVINLYQMHLHKEYFKAAYEMTRTEKARILENKRYYEIIEKIKEDIEKLPLTVRVRMEDIVKEHSINSNLVKKLFKEQYGCGIYEYQISLRMDKAYHLVCFTEKSFKEIAIETGYPQYTDFVNYFKQYFKILPRDLRNKSKPQ